MDWNSNINLLRNPHCASVVLGYLDQGSTQRDETICYQCLCCYCIRLLSFFALVRTEARLVSTKKAPRDMLSMPLWLLIRLLSFRKKADLGARLTPVRTTQIVTFVLLFPIHVWF